MTRNFQINEFYVELSIQVDLKINIKIQDQLKDVFYEGIFNDTELGFPNMSEVIARCFAKERNCNVSFVRLNFSNGTKQMKVHFYTDFQALSQFHILVPEKQSGSSEEGTTHISRMEQVYATELEKMKARITQLESVVSKLLTKENNI